MKLPFISNSWKQLTKSERRLKLLDIEQHCKSQEVESGIEIHPTVYSADGVYAREIFIPAGTLLVGEIHLKSQINVVSQGVIRVATEDGVRTIVAPYTFVSPAGTKRAGYVLEDTVWTTFLPTDKTDNKDVYAEFIAKDYTALDNKLEHKQCHSLQQQ